MVAAYGLYLNHTSLGVGYLLGAYFGISRQIFQVLSKTASRNRFVD
jgi:hypothetical protein